MSTGNEGPQITAEMRSDIVCPLCLTIAIKSNGRLGAIQSYRCMPKPTKGGWETRPQKDKWSDDFFKVINAGRDEEVTLSDGKTKMMGLDRPSDTRVEFTHQEGVAAKQAAIQHVKAGKLRAPRNWDKVFSAQAGMTMDQLKSTYADLYATSSRTAIADAADEPEIEPLNLGFTEDDEAIMDAEPAVEPEALDEDDEERIAEEEQSYSVGSDLDVATLDAEVHMEVRQPAPNTIITLHEPVTCIKALMDGQWVLLFKVVDPKHGHEVWVEEGENHDLSHIFITVK